MGLGEREGAEGDKQEEKVEFVIHKHMNRLVEAVQPVVTKAKVYDSELDVEFLRYTIGESFFANIDNYSRHTSSIRSSLSMPIESMSIKRSSTMGTTGMGSVGDGDDVGAATMEEIEAEELKEIA